MIKTEADFVKLTARQREVLAAIARQLSRDKISQFLHIAEAAANIDAEALLQAYATSASATAGGNPTSISGPGLHAPLPAVTLDSKTARRS